MPRAPTLKRLRKIVPPQVVRRAAKNLRGNKFYNTKSKIAAHIAWITGVSQRPEVLPPTKGVRLSRISGKRKKKGLKF